MCVCLEYGVRHFKYGSTYIPNTVIKPLKVLCVFPHFMRRLVQNEIIFVLLFAFAFCRTTVCVREFFGALSRISGVLHTHTRP